MKNVSCLHRIISFDEDTQTVCGECGDLFSLVVDEDEEEVYFEILHEESNGSFTAFHRTFEEQTKLFNEISSIH
tara:strand:+ start:1841 stop:2062 length:222 start_codon:yes stop_codon:yes gene_type:complete